MTDQGKTPPDEGTAPTPPERDHEVNFFKPATPHERANMKLIMTLVIVWAVAVFGFQFLLIALQEPTPEATHTTFNEAWSAVEANEPTRADRVAVARSILMVLGKNIVLSAEDKALLQQAFSSTVLELVEPAERAAFRERLGSADPSAVQEQVATLLGLSEEGFDPLLAQLLPSSLVALEEGGLSAEARQALPEVMELYTVHNQSALTDFRFLGFPFHYWYTAQFLLILFVLLCLVYAVAIEKIHTKYNFVEE